MANSTNKKKKWKCSKAKFCFKSSIEKKTITYTTDCPEGSPLVKEKSRGLTGCIKGCQGGIEKKTVTTFSTRDGSNGWITTNESTHPR